ncbi:DUF2336 domain-containing protein [Phreatobacter cathodiphilus]|uniref:DUF2336 domain-containing protein n=1 Tax=Phreatobacter cathodiphilus TaxID=1868589 RepID=A0A2S0NFQ9_9HYPH|nr:DUF2336 domain-containing protein [Phreatobacter cathodiphilus]AVO47010.1 hypothetical protein C6569_19200 [Phreatobacter cathodiphilus]
MTTPFDEALKPINSMIGALAPKLRGALVEELVDEITRERLDAESRKALVLDNIVAEALRDAPMPSRVRASPRLARCAGTLPEAATTLACDVIAVAEAILNAPDLPDEIMLRVCAPDRQEHMQIIAKRQKVSALLARAIVEMGEAATVVTLVRNPGAQLTTDGFAEIVARHGADPTVRSMLTQRADCPADLATKFGAAVSRDVPSGDELLEQLQALAEERQIVPAMDLLMRCIGRDRDAGRKILERDDEKALGAICHIAGVDAETYEILVHAWRVTAGKPLTDVHKAPVRFRLMRPAEIDRVISRLPLARMRASEALPA